MEKWKAIKNYEGMYEVSDKGRVKSLKRKYVSEDRVIGGSLSNGYPQVALVKNGKISNHYIHRLIGLAFIDNPDNKDTINHKNGIKNDNRIENLEWVTQQENCEHAVETGLSDYTNRKTRALAVKCITTGKEYISIGEASRVTGVAPNRISQCANHKIYYAGKTDDNKKKIWVLLDENIEFSIERKEQRKQELEYSMSQKDRDELRLKREHKKISQQKIANNIGCNHSMVSRFESGSRDLSSNLLRKYIEQVS